MGLTLSEAKTQVSHWRKPIVFLGSSIPGALSAQGVHSTALLSIPTDKARLRRRELLHLASHPHIPALDALLRMHATCRGWCHSDTEANHPTSTLQRVSANRWGFDAHGLARKPPQRCQQRLTRATHPGKRNVVHKGNDHRQPCTITVGQREDALDRCPPKTAHIHAVAPKETWMVALKPVNHTTGSNGRSAATRLTALARREGPCARCQEPPAQDVPHNNRLSTTRTRRATMASDKDQPPQALARCHACHLEVFQHGTDRQVSTQTVGWHAGCAEPCLAGVGRARGKPTCKGTASSFYSIRCRNSWGIKTSARR